jgi:hypothetical protein
MAELTRRFKYFTDGDWIVLEESEKYLNVVGGPKNRWDRTRIAVTREEIAKLAKEFPLAGQKELANG